ncbi:TraR/DksA C4-type zinc finger protein [Heyndrickxia ginsengihumi]|uniref:YteA family sporulation protein n=1 Tax=Heyndrickxia ginsengihumi TaxID=363870 RepID=A0A0A6VBI8_9BACI|nr:TraR/DksA C4-type zinc finger protein [Heyndrickxia ginsengihumi]KHD85615.1 hypothetical protein NG54_08130 [Heyndrickxia ginsengihumi]MBE6182857.1 yteA family sporulation protein [Bacillus sp. (in: firmicutes)]MCM3024835.1 TraR/DksA C4-type zinc finger protein [Heyndrickxia ginsengihumi]NEY21393.1 yteA family sporulation protein [Heyndrickxia ginsengihumi]
MLTAQQLSHFRSILQDELKEYHQQLNQNDDHYQLERSHPYDSVGELSSYDNHPADTGTELYEREKDFALNEHTEYEIENIKKALQAIDNGTYGKCQTCGKEIPLERLEAIPSTLFCKEHSLDQTIPRKRPIEEDILTQSLKRLNFDDSKDESVVFDSEDSWQAVAKWGTSESPSDFQHAPTDYSDLYIESEENDGYVEDYENFVGTDMSGKEQTIYPSEKYRQYMNTLDEVDMMTTFGDLPRNEKDPYVEDEDSKDR